MIVPNIVDRQVNFSTFCSVSLFPFFSFLRSISYLRFYSNFGIDFRNFSYQFVVRLKVLKFYFLTQVNKIKFKKSFNNSTRGVLIYQYINIFNSLIEKITTILYEER